MKGHTANEQKLYGETWNSVHGGYFADPAIASPLVEAVLDAASAARPSVIADLGGGTGFVLSEVHRRMDSALDPTLVCVDLAREQLNDCPEPVSTLECAAEKVERSMLVQQGGPLLVCMRSVLHYFGQRMLKPDLGHFRSILERGEYLVHQTICFESERDQAIANILYDLLDTGKWYPTVGTLREALGQEGFELTDMRPAPSIPLTSAELEVRYNFSHEAMMEIGRELEEQCGGLSRVYHPSRNGFTVYLDYMVLTCAAT